MTPPIPSPYQGRVINGYPKDSVELEIMGIAVVTYK